MKDLDAQVAALARNMPPPPAASNRTCTWRGQRVTCSADAAAVAAYREAMKAYDARWRASQTGAARFRPGVDAARAERPPRFEPFWRRSGRSRRRPPSRRSGA